MKIVNNRPVFIYLLLDGNGAPLYVGKTINPSLRPKDHRKRFPEAQYVIVEKVSASERWQDRERFWIAYYRQWFALANKAPGGGGMGPLTEEQRTRISLKQKGVPKSPQAVANMKAAKRPSQTAEAKRKVSEFQKDRPKPPRSSEHSQAISRALQGNSIKRGKRVSETGRLNISLAKQGKPWTEARRLACQRSPQ